MSSFSQSSVSTIDPSFKRLMAENTSVIKKLNANIENGIVAKTYLYGTGSITEAQNTDELINQDINA
jgi:hypothetical protein